MQVATSSPGEHFWQCRQTFECSAAEYQANVAVAASKIDEQNPLRSYKPTPGLAGRIALDELYAKGIPATPLSATLAFGLLRDGRLSDDEKIAMTSVLSAIYNRENTSGANQDIALELKRLAADPNKQIAHDAALYYAGLELSAGDRARAQAGPQERRLGY